jgi:hypothetical protein
VVPTQLAAWVGGAGPLAQADRPVGGLLDAQPLGQRGRQQQARVGDRVIVKRDVELVQGVGGCHRGRAVLIGSMTALAGVVLPGQRAFS